MGVGFARGKKGSFKRKRSSKGEEWRAVRLLEVTGRRAGEVGRREGVGSWKAWTTEDGPPWAYCSGTRSRRAGQNRRKKGGLGLGQRGVRVRRPMLMVAVEVVVRACGMYDVNCGCVVLWQRGQQICCYLK